MPSRRRSTKKQPPPKLHSSPAVTRAAAILPSGTGRTVEVQTDLRLLMDMEHEEGEPPQTPEVEQAAAESPTATILSAIETSTATLMGRIDSLAMECGLIRQDMEKFRGRITVAEGRISGVEDAAAATSQQVLGLQRTVKLLMARSEDAENRMRRNNVRVVGLPEGSEGHDPAGYAETFFKKILSLQHVSSAYIVERAHRVPTGPRPQGAPPRPFLVRFLNYRDRDLILAEARKIPQLRFENTTVHFFPDFSPDLQRRRRSFVEVRKRLRDKGLRYGMLYPCKLRIEYRGSVKFFEVPSDVSDWLDTLE